MDGKTCIIRKRELQKYRIIINTLVKTGNCLLCKVYSYISIRSFLDTGKTKKILIHFLAVWKTWGFFFLEHAVVINLVYTVLMSCSLLQLRIYALQLLEYFGFNLYFYSPIFFSDHKYWLVWKLTLSRLPNCAGQGEKNEITDTPLEEKSMNLRSSH